MILKTLGRGLDDPGEVTISRLVFMYIDTFIRADCKHKVSQCKGSEEAEDEIARHAWYF